jgi:hypothetical protein
MTINEILIDTDILLQSAEDDYNQRQYSAYENYLNETNEIINRINKLGIPNDGIALIEQVPPGQKAYMGIGSDPEIAKHREIINTLKKITRRHQKTLPTSPADTTKAEEIVPLLFFKFHLVARQLINRHSGRPTLVVEDEYDVQDLLHSLLKIHFSDIRPEETTPSYAGGSKRLDFLLKDEHIVIEVKKTRKDLNDKKVGEELIIDIATYGSHPDCKKLFCFVYDPDGRINNPYGLETDLQKLSTDKLEVRIFVYPK